MIFIKLLTWPVAAITAIIDILAPQPVTIERHRTYIGGRATSGLRRGDEFYWHDQCGGGQ